MWGQMNLRDSAAYIMQELTVFHDFTLLVLTLIMTFVGIIMANVLLNSFMSKRLTSDHSLEAVWTVLPAIVLVGIAVPSLTLLFSLEDSAAAVLSFKATGLQWYWNYSWVDPGTLDLDDLEPMLAEESYMVKESESVDAAFRLLDTSGPLFLPMDATSRVLITADDVLHSWTVPSFGVKADACPGRLNEVVVCPQRPGEFFGNCSEICGSNHSYMPIHVIVWVAV